MEAISDAEGTDASNFHSAAREGPDDGDSFYVEAIGHAKGTDASKFCLSREGLMAKAGCSEEKEKILTQLEKLDAYDVFFQSENRCICYYDYTAHTFSMHMRYHIARGRKELPQGIDFDGLKHYSHTDLMEFTHRDYYATFGAKKLGRYIHGNVMHRGELKHVTIKTWDVMFPQDFASSISKHLPKRLRDEILLLTNEPFQSCQYVPELIGYSIDKSLAVIYDLKEPSTLDKALGEDSFDWNARCEVAIQLAHLLEFLHVHNITIGSIDPLNILLYGDNKIKLCEFGVCALERDVDFEDMRFIAVYNRTLPEYKARGSWDVKADIFAFGSLLVELMTVDDLGGDDRGRSLLAKKLLVDGNGKLAHEALVQDKNVRDRAYNLVMHCLDKDPVNRWEPSTIIEELGNLVSMVNEWEHRKL